MNKLRVLKLCALAALFAALVLPLSCKNPLSVSAGDGKASIKINWNRGSERTILPQTYPDVTSYDVTLTPAAGDPIVRTGITGTTLQVWDIAAGTYAITVTGKDSLGTELVSGTATGIALTTGLKTVATVKLAYITSSGTGSFHLVLDFSASGTVPDSVSLTLFDPSGNPTTPALTGSGASYSLSGENVAAGAYRALVRASSGTAVATRTESIVVFKELVSTGTVSFSKADFRQPARAIGNYLSLFSGPGSAIFDGSGDVANFTNECANENIADHIWSFYGPLNLGMVKDGNVVYVADRFANAIRKVDLSSGAVTTVAGECGTVGSADGVGSSARFEGPQGIVKLGSYLYVADTMNHTIRQIDTATWQVTTIAGRAGVPGNGGQSDITDGDGTAALFRFPTDIATDGTDLYVADSGSRAIRKITGAEPHTVTTELSSVYLRTIACAGKYIYYAGTTSVVRYDPDPFYGGSYGAGNINAGNVDGSLTASRFTNIKDIAVNGDDVYVTDGNAVRKVSFTSDNVSTLAGVPGTGSSSSFIDQETGYTASLSYPTALAYGDNTLYVFDSINQVLKKIDLTGQTVSRVAGTRIRPGFQNGSATASRYDNIEGIASDGTYLYVSESRYNTIRKVSIATGASSTFSGKPSVFGEGGYADGSAETAEFSQPTGLAVLGEYLYVCDTGNLLIRKVKLSDGSVTTFAGSLGQSGKLDGVGSDCSFLGPRLLAADGEKLYLIDTAYSGTPGYDGTARLCSIDPANADTRTLDTVHPNILGLTVDETKIYLADGQYCEIVAINKETLSQNTVAGRGNYPGYLDGVGASAYFMAPKGLASDGTYLYVCDLDNYAVRKILIDAQEVTTFAGKGKYPGLVYGSGGESRLRGPEYCVMVGTTLYVTDQQTQSILKIQ